MPLPALPTLAVSPTLFPFLSLSLFLSSALALSTEPHCSVCIVGGGVSGLAAACALADSGTTSGSISDAAAAGGGVVLLEAASVPGGRVRTDRTEDGYILDAGFAVFLEGYPLSRRLLDYDRLDLRRFDPGALVVRHQGGGPAAAAAAAGEGDPPALSLGRVADPLRQPGRLLDALLSPVGSLLDKARLAPLLLHVRTSTVADLFQEKETDALSCLRGRWGFSEAFVGEFLAPFLEGIYLCPLERQSSRMFHFVFKMFSEGEAALPRAGIGAVAEQLTAKAARGGPGPGLEVEIRTDSPVASISVVRGEAKDDGDGPAEFEVQVEGGPSVRAESVIVAADVRAARRLLSGAGFEGLGEEDGDPEPVDRSVGCLYYGFQGPAPIDEPILVLNGMGDGERGSANSPINNACFPSVVSDTYAPKGCHLCSVTVLQGTMDAFEGRHGDLDRAVRRQLAEWFPAHAEAISDPALWDLKAVQHIRGAQPAQYACPYPASANGGRAADQFRGRTLPRGVFVAGDHHATASLNGALESGVNAARASHEFFTKKEMKKKEGSSDD